MSRPWRTRPRLCRSPSRYQGRRTRALLRGRSLRLQGAGGFPSTREHPSAQRQRQGAEARSTPNLGHLNFRTDKQLKLEESTPMVAKALLNPREDNRMSQLLAGSPKNWVRWGPDDQVGGLNFLTSAEILRGARAIRQGKVITCGEVIGSPTGDPIFPGRTQPQRANTQDFGDYQSGKKNPLPGGIQYADDQITMFLQGSTQYDALGHVWYDDQLWNGYSASETVGGMKKASILPIAERGVVGRGVLLDM